ncbi:SRPBCC domain-containing protein [Phenylobacterium sp. J367]|uniref:SRPBCC domain-containing protein n=1 Tax=Phenylobacterium sp. J367 TaxID=2898435 RepID=UPI0021518E40|nr:SRPBCC domain-containing protein [Phenylobacterium sp. J367]
MNDFGMSPGPGVVRFERLLPGPIERVWAYLTESEKRGRWFAVGEMDLREGGHADINFRHAQLSDVPDPPPRSTGR